VTEKQRLILVNIEQVGKEASLRENRTEATPHHDTSCIPTRNPSAIFRRPGVQNESDTLLLAWW